MSTKGEYSRTKVRGYNRIRLDRKSTEEVRAEIREQELQKLEIKVPKPAGSGEMYEELKSMGENMKLIYDQVQILIRESGEMLDEMYKPFERADLLGNNSFNGGLR